ncbi:NRDE family protein [Novosphingobium sp.]|uniref:NRDE family protein n=1 Tax=Novosphingobium sp. TaxID=1874826 RepID=UPI0035B44288
MCVAAIAWDAHPRWKLIAIGNRDEFHARPTAPLAQWDNGIIAGRDLEAGGTWLGIAPGRFALVTNYRVDGYPQPHLASRGSLVTNWLLDQDLGDLAGMNPFHLFAAGPGGAAHLSNYPSPLRTPLEPGIHGLSNGGFERRWGKTQRLEAALAEWLNASNDPDQLFTPLADRTLDGATDPEGPSAEFSSVFISNPLYGTRCSTVIAVDRDGQGTIAERRFASDGSESGRSSIGFDWDG